MAEIDSIRAAVCCEIVPKTRTAWWWAPLGVLFSAIGAGMAVVLWRVGR